MSILVGVGRLPAHRLPQEERKEKVTVRLRKKVIEAIEKAGTKQEILEKLAEEYVKKNKLLE